MANISAGRHSTSIAFSPSQFLCIIVGLACLISFLIDIAILALPPDPFNIQWRINVLRQVGDRSIVLLFGSALTMYGFLSSRSIRKKLALICLAVGVMFSVSGILMAHDSLRFQDITLVNISNQENQVRNQIKAAQDNPQDVAPDLTPEILEQATQQLSQRAENAKKTAKNSIIKTGAGSIGNLIVTGFALIAIGRFGNRTIG